MTKTSAVVVLGASNLTRGFPVFVSTVRAAYGPDVQVIAAHGHGRSYGSTSRVGFRTLPGILESGLWRKLEAIGGAEIRAFVTDIGNDIMYGYSPGTILTWAKEVVSRLRAVTRDITLTNLPLFNIRRMSHFNFLLFRSILFPSCRLSYARVLGAAEEVDAGISEMSLARNIRLFRLNPEWYGFDPVHIRRSYRRSAWSEMLGNGSGAREGTGGLMEEVRLRLAPPERRWLFGVEQFKAQSGLSLPSGGQVWLY